ncbi:MAG: hypothetical protein A3D92_08130 [Bacteroidetes bacterium RIFCSPHIGHO2_02_FULL_44_7]|nr:MAG: hypothetical protein A3D92_08130 [Bacteroidetes bacterium RIFCSPHIGHO2_02_FULL_44_7]
MTFRLSENLPWDKTQWLQVKRRTEKEKRHSIVKFKRVRKIAAEYTTCSDEIIILLYAIQPYRCFVGLGLKSECCRDEKGSSFIFIQDLWTATHM